MLSSIDLPLLTNVSCKSVVNISLYEESNGRELRGKKSWIRIMWKEAVMAALEKSHFISARGLWKITKTFVTITRTKAEILKEIHRNDTGHPDGDVSSPTFPLLFHYRLHVFPLVPSLNFCETSVSPGDTRTPGPSAFFWLSLSAQYCIKNNRLYKEANFIIRHKSCIIR